MLLLLLLSSKGAIDPEVEGGGGGTGAESDGGTEAINIVPCCSCEVILKLLLSSGNRRGATNATLFTLGCSICC